MKHFETKIVPKSDNNFKCEICDYSTSRKSQYIRHLSTDKHKTRTCETNETKMKQKSVQTFDCICGNLFNSRTTLWRHKKTCKGQQISSHMITPELVLDIIKDMKQIILDQNNTISNLIQTKPTTKSLT